MKERYLKLTKVVVFCTIFALLFLGIADLFKDKRISFLWDTSRKVNGFYNEPENTLDFVFVGSSQVFTSVAPAVLWEEYGITSYVFAANEQPFWISYHYIKEILKYQKPLAIVLDVRYSYFQEEYAKEGVNRYNLDDLKFSPNKIAAIQDAVPENERLSYYIEFMKYHDNWRNLNEDHFKEIKNIHNPYKGYTPMLYSADYPDELDVAASQQTQSEALSARTEEYLLKIIELSRKEDFELLLIKTPDTLPDGQKYYNTVGQIAKEQGIAFVNYNTIMTGANHMSILRAEEFSKHLGNYLTENYDVVDKRGDPNFSNWSADSAYFYRQKQNCFLKNEEHFAKYVELLNNPNYMIFVASQGENLGLHAMDLPQAETLGLPGMVSGEKACYVGALDDGVEIFEEASAHSILYQARIGEMSIEVRSNEYKGVYSASILINGKEHALNQRGLNIVVYDKFLDEIVDSVCFDRYNQMQAYR